jgi:orotate phosphoribosyltransferase
MNKWEVLEIFREHRAIVSGHFRLSSGLHSDTYVQCARILQYPHIGESLADELASRFDRESVDLVLSPAIGGIVIGYLVALALDRRMVFAERENGKLTLRRGQEIAPGERVLLVEDVITTGGSLKELEELLRERGAVPVGIAAIIRRGAGIEFSIPVEVLLDLDIKAWDPDSCPLCRDGIPLETPGSRFPDASNGR